MTSTEQLEKYQDFVFKDIRKLIDDSAGERGRLMRDLQNLEDNITGESRKNKAVLEKAGEECEQFFDDMIFKVQSTKSKLFDEDNDHVIYKPIGLLIEGTGDILIDYAFKLHESLNNVISIFESRKKTGSIGQNLDTERTTSLPSFTMPHLSAAYILYEGLKKYGYIICTQSEFLNAFEGRIITSQIRWYKANSHLTHMIKRLCSEGIINDPGKNDRWPLTIKVFCKKDGGQFINSQLSESSSDVRLNGVPQIDQLINSLKPRRRV